jgi:hypothetical protein
MPNVDQRHGSSRFGSIEALDWQRSSKPCGRWSLEVRINGLDFAAFRSLGTRTLFWSEFARQPSLNCAIAIWSVHWVSIVTTDSGRLDKISAF